MERYDIAIIGTGPAGVSAAITSRIRNKNILLLGQKAISDKVSKASMINNYPGLPEITGIDLQKAYRNHLRKLDIDMTEDRVNTVYAMGDYFYIQGTKNNYEALSVILATGADNIKTYDGESENVGRGVSYCATCDAALYRGREAVVVGYSKEAFEEAQFLAEMASKVYYIPAGKHLKDMQGISRQKTDLKGDKFYKIQKETELKAAEFTDKNIEKVSNIEILQDVSVVSIEKEDNKMCLNTNNGKIITDGIFILRESLRPAQLVPGLKITENRVETDRLMATNIKGLYAAGDITGSPYQYIKAAGEGNVAALSAVGYLASKRR